jgi:hypothetical protein
MGEIRYGGGRGRTSSSEVCQEPVDAIDPRAGGVLLRVSQVCGYALRESTLPSDTFDGGTITAQILVGAVPVRIEQAENTAQTVSAGGHEGIVVEQCGLSDLIFCDIDDRAHER